MKVKNDDGSGLSGKDRLTDKQIDSLQYYCGQIVRDEVNNLYSVKKAVGATLLNKPSSDDHPQHLLCPKGENIWCSTSRANYRKPNKIVKNELTVVIFEAIKPIYLSNPEVLKKCLHGKQFVNQVLNVMIWDRCPKTYFAPRSIDETDVKDAVGCFNVGNIARCKVC